MAEDEIERKIDYLLVDSPIERLMLGHLEALVSRCLCSPISRVVSLVAMPQCEIGPYRVDFLLTVFHLPRKAGEGTRVKEYVIECDGHEFHEKTKAQAARDKRRDRYFASQGYKVFRYTGAEIYASEMSLLADLERAIMNDLRD